MRRILDERESARQDAARGLPLPEAGQIFPGQWPHATQQTAANYMALPPARCVRIRPLQAGLDNWLIQVFNRPVDYIATRSGARAAQ
jgi:hypothetical protein